MYVEIHAKDELRFGRDARGKRTYVNFTMGKDSIRISREPQRHIESPAWYLEMSDSRDYPEGRPDGQEIQRTVLLQLTPSDIDAILESLVMEQLIELRGLRATAA